jgi:hypothetical protein
MAFVQTKLAGQSVVAVQLIAHWDGPQVTGAGPPSTIVPPSAQEPEHEPTGDCPPSAALVLLLDPHPMETTAKIPNAMVHARLMGRSSQRNRTQLGDRSVDAGLHPNNMVLLNRRKGGCSSAYHSSRSTPRGRLGRSPWLVCVVRHVPFDSKFFSRCGG